MDLDARQGALGSPPDLEGGVGNGHVSLYLRVVPSGLNDSDLLCGGTFQLIMIENR